VSSPGSRTRRESEQGGGRDKPSLRASMRMRLSGEPSKRASRQLPGRRGRESKKHRPSPRLNEHRPLRKMMSSISDLASKSSAQITSQCMETI
jgi:hypothetical protein